MVISPSTARARELRQKANPAEMALWSVLKNRQLAGYKFTRQFAIGPYFADFANRRHFLLLELDGSQHANSQYDHNRDQWLANEGYSILRIPAASVHNNLSTVCDAILAALEGRMETALDAPDLRFLKTTAVPRRFTRHRPWAEK